MFFANLVVNMLQVQRVHAQAAVTKEECQVVEAEAKEGVGQLSDGTMWLSAVSGL